MTETAEQKVVPAYIIVERNPFAQFKKAERQPVQSGFKKVHKIGLLFTAVLMGATHTLSVVASADRSDKSRNEALDKLNREDRVAKVIPAQHDSNSGPSGLNSAGFDGGQDDSPSQEQQPTNPDQPSGLRPPVYDHTQLDPIIRHNLEQSARDRGGDPLVRLDFVFDENGELRIQNSPELEDRNFFDLFAGEGSINETFTQLVRVLQFQGLTSGFRVELLGSNWTRPDETTLAVFVTLTEDAQLNYREAGFRAGSRFFVSENGSVFPVEVNENEGVQVFAYSQDLYQQLLPGFPNLPTPLAGEMVALVVQDAPQRGRVMKVFFGDGSFFDTNDTSGQLTPQPEAVPEPPEESGGEVVEGGSGEEGSAGPTPERAEIINESTIPPDSISSTRAYIDSLGGYWTESEGGTTEVHRPMFGDTEVYSVSHTGPNGGSFSIERPVEQYRAGPTGVDRIEYLDDETPQMENFEQGMRQIYLDFYRKMYPGVDPEQALLEDRVITFSWLENPIAVNSIRIGVRQGISTQAELDAIIRSNLVEYSFRPSQGASFVTLYPMGAEYTYPGVVAKGYDTTLNNWGVPKGFVATPEGRLIMATEHHYDYYNNMRSRGTLETASAHVGHNAVGHMAFRLALLHHLIGPNPDFAFVLDAIDPFGSEVDPKTSQYGSYLGIGDLNFYQDQIDTEMYPKTETGAFVIPNPNAVDFSPARAYWND